MHTFEIRRQIEILTLFAEAQRLASPLHRASRDEMLAFRLTRPPRPSLSVGRQQRRQQRRAKGLCCECDTPTGDARYCERHRQMARARKAA